MCNRPVMFGGGMTMVKVGRPSRDGSITFPSASWAERKAPASSHRR